MHRMMRPKRSRRVPKNQPATPIIKLNRRVSIAGVAKISYNSDPEASIRYFGHYCLNLAAIVPTPAANRKAGRKPWYPRGVFHPSQKQ